MSLSGIIPAAISTEMLQLITKLFDKLRTQNPDIKLVMDQHGFQFINNEIITNEIMPMEEENSPPAPDEEYMTEFEQEIISGIMKASNGTKAQLPPRLHSDAFALVDYDDLCKYTYCSATSLHYEIGRVLIDVTAETRT